MHCYASIFVPVHYMIFLLYLQVIGEENQRDIAEFCRKEGHVLLANEVGKFLLAKDVETSCNSSNK